MWLGIDKVSDPARRVSAFDEVQQDGSHFSLIHHDLFIEPHLLVNPSSVAVYCTPTSEASGVGNYFFADTLISGGYISSFNDVQYPSSTYFSSEGAADLPDSTQKLRVAPTDSNLVVKVEVADDKIKATTDDQVWYAVPAECNVDIVLAVPTNGAACNVNNRDMASDTPENCYVSTSTVDSGRIWVLPTSVASGKQSPKQTPIYQMGQALKGFVKNNFYHTRGVNMALIPYSGKISIPPDRATSWTVAFPPFVDTSTNTQLMIGACLYGTSGVKGDTLKQSAKTASRVSSDTLRTTDTPYYWGDIISACPIMFRAGYQQTETKYGGNSYFRGFLGNYAATGSALSATDTDPSKGASYKYLRMNYNPCCVGYANMLSMRCEKNCDSFVPNPYYMIEPTADLVKIYEMCNALYPIYDEHNISNFIFAPLEWAYNMFQTWTRNTNCAAKSGSGRTSSGSDDGATLSRPSKTTSGRKKAVILLVNKPDWFEPGEMTYLGFNNDKSEVPTVLSDKIDFSIDYTDTSKTYLDGSSYDGSYYGVNKILKCTISGTTYTLTFPRAGLLLVRVKPASTSGTFKFTAGTSNTTSYTIYDEKVFALKPSQITATTVSFSISGLTVISVEMTNRPYSSKTASATYNTTDTAQIDVGNLWFNGCEETGSETTVSVTGLNDLLTANATKTNGILTYTGGTLTSRSDTLTATATTGSAPVNETISGLSTGTKNGTMFSYTRNSSSTISESVSFWNNTRSNSTNFSFDYTPKANGTDTIRLTSKYYGDITFKADYGKLLRDFSTADWTDICYCKDLNIFVASGTNGDGNGTNKSYNGICWYRVSTTSWAAIAYDPYRKRFIGVGNGHNNVRYSPQNLEGSSTKIGTLPINLTQNWCHGSIVVSDNGNIVVAPGYAYNEDGAGRTLYSKDGGSSWTNWYHDKMHPSTTYSSGINKFFFKTADSNGMRTISNPPTSSLTDYAWVDAQLGSGNEFEGPTACDGNKRFVCIDDVGYLMDFDYDQKKFVYLLHNTLSGRWTGLAYTLKGKYYVMLNKSGVVRTYNGAGTVSGEASISAHNMKYGSTTTTVGTSGASMTIPASALTTSNANSYYIDVTTTGACANSASLNCYTETDTLTLPSGITSGTVRFSTTMKNTYRKIYCTTTGGNKALTAAGYLDVTATGRTSLAYNLHGVTASSAQMINCYMPCETGGSITVSGITSAAKQRKGTVYLKAKVRSGQTGKLTINSSSQQNVTSSTGADYSVAITNVSGNTVDYTFPNNNALINTQKVSARYDYSIPSGGTLSWNGIGKRIKSVVLTVAPTVGTGSISFTNLSNNSTYNQNISSQKDITVDGSYLTADNVKYTLTNAVILSASVKYKLLQPYQFTKQTVPSWSTTADYSSSSKPTYNSNLITCTIGSSTSYDNNLGYWVACAGGNDLYDLQFYAKNDLYLILEEKNAPNASTIRNLWYGTGDVNGGSSCQVSTYLPGLNRIYYRANEYWDSFGFGNSGRHALIVGGVTQPINVALYNYAYGTGNTNLDSYVSPSTDFNRTVLKQLTTAACAKLKADYGSNVRVYVVKYRKQAKWNCITRGKGNIDTAHSYAEIDNCASTTGGTAYDVTTEADLKAKLDAIAADIKDLAEYEEAKNIAPE